MSAPRRGAAADLRRVAIYTRKSVARGLEQDFNSLDAQRDQCERFAEARVAQGWMVLPERYDDGGFTGANLDRPAFQRLRQDIEAGKIDVVLIYKLDRLSRSIRDFIQFVEWLDQHGVQIASATQPIDTSGPMGRFVTQLLMLLAQLERETTSERTRDKIRAARLRGKWTGGPIPFGYRSGDSRLHVVPEEAAVVRELFDTYLSVRSARGTAQALNALGHRRRKGKRWTKASVLAVLKDPLVRGLIRAGDELVDAEHEGIVTAEVYARTDLLLESHARPDQPRSRSAEYLLTGILTCAGCGGSLTPGCATTRGKKYRYYRCVMRDKVGKHACDTRPVRAEVIEDFVVQQVREIAVEPDVVAAVVAELHERIAAERARLRTEQSALPDVIADRLDECSRLIESMDRLTGAARGAIEDRLQAVATSQQQAEARQVEVERELLAMDHAEADAGWVQQALERFADVWELMTAGNQGRLLRALVARVSVNEATGDVEVELHRMDEPMTEARSEAGQ